MYTFLVERLCIDSLIFLNQQVYVDLLEIRLGGKFDVTRAVCDILFQYYLHFM